MMIDSHAHYAHESFIENFRYLSIPTMMPLGK